MAKQPAELPAIIVLPAGKEGHTSCSFQTRHLRLVLNEHVWASHGHAGRENQARPPTKPVQPEVDVGVLAVRTRKVSGPQMFPNQGKSALHFKRHFPK